MKLKELPQQIVSLICFNIIWQNDDSRSSTLVDDLNAYWRMFMAINDYLNDTRGYPLTLEEKFQVGDIRTSDTIMRPSMATSPANLSSIPEAA